MVERSVWERFLGLEVVIGPIRQALELEGEAVLCGGLLDGLEGCIDDFGPDPIPGEGIRPEVIRAGPEPTEQDAAQHGRTLELAHMPDGAANSLKTKEQRRTGKHRTGD